MTQSIVGIDTATLGKEIIFINNRFAARGEPGFEKVGLQADPIPAANAVLDMEDALDDFDRQILRIFLDRVTTP